MSMTKGAIKLVVSKLSYPSSVEDNTSYNQIIWSPINLNLATKIRSGVNWSIFRLSCTASFYLVK